MPKCISVEHGDKLVGIEFIQRFGDATGYGILPFIKLYLQDQLRRAGLDYEVKLEKRAS